ncbi:MAG: SDR family NAD(P)-dependent oxidoreductase [Sphingomonadaceae bacterium]
MLDGRTILVVGCTSGIGAEIYRACIKAGATVIGIGRRNDQGRALAEECGGLFEAVDITDDSAISSFFDTLPGRGIILDGAINNAATTHDAIPVDQMDMALFDQVFSINVRALFYCLSREIAMMRGHGGAVVNVASIAGIRGYPGLSLYSASKHAVVGLTKSAALDGARDNIRVNALLPGTTRTEMFETQMQTRPGGEEMTVAGIPLGRVSGPEEPAAAALWLLSDQASFVTGTTLVSDGGRTAC